MRTIRLPLILLLLILQPVAAQILPRLRRHEGVSVISISYGQQVVNAGDMDGDGVQDYIVSSPDETIGNPSPPQYRGVVRVYSGATGAVIHTIQGLFNFDHLGWSIGGGGDVDADGVPDIIVGIPLGANTSATGEVRVYSGVTGLMLWYANLGLLYGSRVANAGDVNGDGFDDVIVSTHAWSLPGNNTLWPVKVLSGINGSVIWSIATGLTYDSFGLSVGGAVDLDLDGFDDFLVGWGSYGGIGGQIGAVLAFSGATGSQIRLFAGAPVYSFLGQSIAVSGDLDGDLIPEIVAGGFGSGSVGVPGIVRVYSGAAGGLIHSLTAPILADGFGSSVASGFDLDGDGFSDFATATPDTNPSGPPVPVAFARGAVRAFSGATGAPIGIIPGAAPGNNYGSYLAMLSDTNGDGFAEIVCGSTRDDTALGTDGGSVELLSFVGWGNYLSGNGSLNLVRLNGAPGALGDGLVLAHGATPASSGVIAADLVPANTTSGTPPFPLYLAVTPALVQVPVTYDATGAWGVGVNLRNPALAGTTIFAQAFELAPGGVISSAGLQMLFGP